MIPVDTEFAPDLWKAMVEASAEIPDSRESALVLAKEMQEANLTTLNPKRVGELRGSQAMRDGLALEIGHVLRNEVLLLAYHQIDIFEVFHNARVQVKSDGIRVDDFHKRATALWPAPSIHDSILEFTDAAVFNNYDRQSTIDTGANLLVANTYVLGNYCLKRLGQVCTHDARMQQYGL